MRQNASEFAIAELTSYGLSERALCALEADGLTMLRELLAKTPAELLLIRNVSVTTQQEILSSVRNHRAIYGW
jgi:hypothetical protein